MTTELWFHLVEILVMIFGLALPMMWGIFRIVSILKDYPPHRHINGKIIYPSGYQPTELERLNAP